MYEVGDYIEDGYRGHQIFVPTDIYSKVLDAIVVACVDVMLVYEDRAIIAKRAQFPHADWWLLGGRMYTGEHLTQAASRLMRREAKLQLPESRFNFLTTFAGAWKKRTHDPVNNGTHTLSVVFRAAISKEELDGIELNEEYSAWKLMTPDDLIGNNYHPAIIQCARALKASGYEKRDN
jgi:ADP-ribose pyrophosphatase YjhB (NUDIX family)